MPARRSPSDGERGESLLEVLIAITILGVAIVGVLTGVSVSISATNAHRKGATAGVLVRSYAEAVEATVANGGYAATCAPTYGSTFAVPTGFTKSISTAKLWDAATSTWVPCGGATPDVGLQQLTVTVASNDGRATETITLVVRKPCATGSTCT